MTTTLDIQEMRKQHNEERDRFNYTLRPAQIDVLFAEIDRLTADNDRLARELAAAKGATTPPPPAATTTTSDDGRKLTKAQRRELAKFDHPDGLVVDYPQNGGEPQPDGDVTRSMFYKLSALKLIERVTDETEIVRGFGGKVWRRYYYTTTESGRAALAGRGA